MREAESGTEQVILKEKGKRNKDKEIYILIFIH